MMEERTEPGSLAESYKQNGYILKSDILSKDETEVYLKGFLDYESRLGGKVTGAYRFKAHLLLPWLYDLVTHPKVVNLVCQLLGPDVVCWSTDLFPKDPGTGKSCGWHQDSTYIGMEPPDALTVWVALTDSNKMNGCVEFSSKSHLKGQFEHTNTMSDKSMLLYGQEIPVEVDRSTVVLAELSAGQASVHHVMTVHSSGPNMSKTRRIGVALRYCGAYVKQKAEIGDSVTHVCGKDHGNFTLEPPPAQIFGENEVNAHQKACGPIGPEDLIAVK
ncbi:L-threonyl-[L-threonyl-carrier protein] 4-chlorinase-like [Ylistrum balloti]|uniref:L-threonyl-[L-threonyl-carrier protein] 4-chlorinase-like n=1 Tax=Ylistrum balloti TaxID=509963 RepID=UPI002905D2B3|nr:L-threonyl-[L-threonyl-carrier protein] 4-chlorinase-like [Ylistrum balloti]